MSIYFGVVLFLSHNFVGKKGYCFDGHTMQFRALYYCLEFEYVVHIMLLNRDMQRIDVQVFEYFCISFILIDSDFHLEK